MMCWAIWKRQNDKVWEGNVQPAAVALRNTMDLLHNWTHARGRAGTTATPANSLRHEENRWQKPSPGEYKCNVDTTIFNMENKYEIRIVVHKTRVSSIEERRCGLMDYHLLKRQKLQDFGRLCFGLGLPTISIELDYLPVVNGVQGEPNTNTEFGTLISYCRHFLTSKALRVSYIRRQANSVAHTLVRA